VGSHYLWESIGGFPPAIFTTFCPGRTGRRRWPRWRRPPPRRPAAPPSANAIASRAPRWPRVHRSYVATSFGNRSAKIARGQRRATPETADPEAKYQLSPGDRQVSHGAVIVTLDLLGSPRTERAASEACGCGKVQGNRLGVERHLLEAEVSQMRKEREERHANPSKVLDVPNTPSEVLLDPDRPSARLSKSRDPLHRRAVELAENAPW
jgi:hypothetical protein